MNEQEETCAHCWIPIGTGKKAYRDGKAYHAQCYMFSQHGIAVKTDQIKDPHDNH